MRYFILAVLAGLTLSGCAVNTLTVTHHGDVMVDASGGIKEMPAVERLPKASSTKYGI
jgi:uncharacterized protein YceK